MSTLFIFLYSVGLTMTLTGLNILVDCFPPEERSRIAKILIGAGLFFTLIAPLFS